MPSPVFPPQPTCLLLAGQFFPHTTNCPSWPGHSSPTQPIGQPLFPLTTICLLIPSLFPPSQPFSYCFPVSFLPHNHLPIVSQSLFPLTTICLLFPSLFSPSQPVAYCFPLSLFSLTTFGSAERQPAGLADRLPQYRGRKLAPHLQAPPLAYYFPGHFSASQPFAYRFPVSLFSPSQPLALNQLDLLIVSPNTGGGNLRLVCKCPHLPIVSPVSFLPHNHLPTVSQSLSFPPHNLWLSTSLTC